ncbi:uncharacterized protein FA14DRAFT_181252 [Meira miltonrushii]|uniref:RING-type E3 ubiquitin transferase n=1 Tax=Meira miltonrushii TaxID=1280837 RepID=A0A316V6C1_9BASI|nr:uncharacterized protein FA14DRAFT_181252 [Meira miltonrushii]PWN32568.1 hypothetical protein FA14DRAFT_181252 [Meira miltonrushii]
MRLFPPINRTTLDSFHRDVYRPRLSLLLLILLLILGQQHQHEQAQNRQLNQPVDTKISTAKAIRDDHGKLKVTQFTGSDGGLIGQLAPLLDQLPDRMRLDKSTFAIRWAKKAGELTWKGMSQDTPKATEAVALDKTQADHIKKSLRDRLASGKRSSKPAFSSPLRRSKGGKKKEQTYRSLLAKVLNADALSALVSLHLLWAIRLGSMMLEDRLGKDNTSAPSNLSSSQSYMFLIGSAFLALLSSFFSWSTVFQRWGIIRPPTHTTPAIAIQILTLLELSATFVSFLPPLFRMRTSPLAQVLPRKISLPSPSHSPSLLDLLPIPAGLIEAFKAPREDTMTYSRRRMGNQWHGGGRHMIAAPLPGINAGDLTGAGAENATGTDQPPPNTQQRQRSGIAEPLRMPRANAGKAPRMKGMRVNVDSSWLLENVVILYGHAIGAIQYIVVIVSLPTFTPTSFPSLLSLLSLRSALGSVVMTWCSARRSVECLEFVQRRWSQQESPPDEKVEQSSSLAGAGSVCSMCFEIVDETEDPEDCCTLDCGHQLHSVCLVQWLTKQAFCPCCHSTLKATPPSMRTAAETAASVT